VDTLEVVNLRLSAEGTGEESVAEEFGALAQMQKEGLIRHLGLSAASAAQLTEAEAIAPVVTRIVLGPMIAVGCCGQFGPGADLKLGSSRQ
jgi:aryl-alcohol dehydrogenase-like predicted oxidoreductase